ncbi:MAG TPA: hypothetical protein VFL04_01655, partial [Rectinemataceae bacterium]|nr:hypothetical protein [Rectinemataceae bacterium]
MEAPRLGLEEGRELLADAIASVPPGREGLRDFYAEDLVLPTGLPLHLISALLPGLVVEAGARVAATAAGRVLWRFPAGPVAQRRPGRKGELRSVLMRALRRVAEGLIQLGWSSWAYLAFLAFGSRRA